MTGISDLLHSAATLPPLPPVAPKLAQILSDTDSSAADVADVLQYDQALTLDVLKYANCVLSSSSRRIVTVREAVIRVGGARILEHIVARHVKKALQMPLDPYGYSGDELWRHSVAAATAAEQLGTLTGSPGAGVSFTAALLHDVGKLVLVTGAPTGAMKRVVAGVFAEKTFELAEREEFGFSHADIGAAIAESWLLPRSISEAIRNHHAYGERGSPASDAVKISNLVALSIGEGIGHEGMKVSIDRELAARAGMTRERFETLCAATGAKLTSVLSMFDL